MNDFVIIKMVYFGKVLAKIPIVWLLKLKQGYICLLLVAMTPSCQSFSIGYFHNKFMINIFNALRSLKIAHTKIFDVVN